MPAANRSVGRNVHIYNADTPIGGLILANGVTNSNFYSMIEIICIFEQDFVLRDELGMTVQRDGLPLQPCNYYILTNGSITVNDEPWLVRAQSLPTGSRAEPFFRKAVRERDHRCVITGEQAVMADYGNWVGYEAAHVFPLEFEGH